MNPRFPRNFALCSAVALAACGADPTPMAVKLPSSEVELVVDTLGITHVYAQSDRDALYGGGYAEARDRLFEMELNRRRAAGTLSEVVGKVGLSDDRQARVIGFARLGTADAALLRHEAPEDAELLDAWVAGVNAFIDEVASGVTPRPFGFRATELDFLPAHWTAEDATSVGKLLAFGLSSTLDYEVLASVLRNLAKDAVAHYPLVLPAYDDVIVGPPAGPTNHRAAPTGTRIARGAPPTSTHDDGPWPPASSLPATWQSFSAPNGSNNWAVDGAHSQNGRPLLCGDPHQSLSSPQNFWPVHLSSVAGGGTLDVVGFIFPGTPFVELGHNAHLGWTATTSFADVMDLWDVSTTADAVSLGGKDRPMLVTEEVIHVRRDGAPVGQSDDTTVEVRTVPGFGVLLPSEVLPVPTAFIARGDILLNWTGFAATHEALSYLALDRARTLDEFEAAVDRLDVGAVNLVAADATGIDYRMHAAVPDRGDPSAHPMPWHILDGDDPAGLWTDATLPASRLPHLRAPDKGFLSSANNDPFGFTLDGNVENDPFYFGAFYAVGFRAHHIAAALSSMVAGGKQVARADLEKLQSDVHSPMADELLPRVALALAAIDTDPTLAPYRARADVRDLAARLIKWNGDFTSASSEAAVFLGLEWFAAKRAFSDRFSPLMFAAIESGSPPFFLGALRNVLTGRAHDGAYFLPDGEAVLLLGALADTADWLTSRFGSTAANAYHLGDVNFAVFANKYLPALSSPPVAVAGGPDTIHVSEAAFFDNNGAPRATLASKEISLYRMALQFGDDGVPEAEVQIARGVSGDPSSPHFGDLEPSWRDGVYRPLPFRRADVQAATESRVVLPASP